jgi:hypothetical protein
LLRLRSGRETTAQRARRMEIRMTLTEHIQKQYGGNQAAFAQSQNVKPQQITQWIAKGFIVVDGVLYSPRRELI